MATLTQASDQWATRPADERFLSLHEMAVKLGNIRDNSIARVLPSRSLECFQTGADHRSLQVVIDNDTGQELTHWSFGQIAKRASVPADYARTLPAALAADCINFGLQVTREVADIGVLSYRNGGPAQLRAVTGPGYGRIWNADIVNQLIQTFGDGVTGDFRVPGEFGKAVQVTRDNTTLYASDRDMFVFLADETRRIEMPNRRHGQHGSLARGFFVQNSENGDKSFLLTKFLFDYVCCNRIVWGAEGVEEIRFAHNATAPHRWIEQAVPALLEYVNSGTEGITEGIARAQQKKIDDVDKFLLSRKFGKAQITAIKAAHMKEEERPIETFWDAATGITAHAKSVFHQDERVEFERKAGAILDLA